MNNTDTTIRKALVLWLSGVRLADIRTLPQVKTLIERGATVELDASPITGPQSQYYQVFSGKSPASLAFLIHSSLVTTRLLKKTVAGERRRNCCPTNCGPSAGASPTRKPGQRS